MSITVEFTEEMKGFAGAGQTDYGLGESVGRNMGQTLLVHLCIRTEDIDAFLLDPKHRGVVTGYVDSPLYGGRCAILDGEFDCLVEVNARSRRIFYRLAFGDAAGNPHTLFGEKRIVDDGVLNAWRDCSTLFVHIVPGTVPAQSRDQANPEASGIIHIEPLSFVRELGTFKGEGGSFAQNLEAVEKFGKFFLVSLWQVYKPKRGPIPSQDDKRQIPIFSLHGVNDAEVTTSFFSTPDYLGLQLFRFKRASCSRVVVLIHGLTTSTDMFIMPEHRNIVNFLLDHGYTDVWSLDWRGSMRYSYDLFPAQFTMDDIALYDMPAAFAAIRQAVGPQADIHVICHCVGSLTFLMSLSAGLVHGIKSVVSNSVSLTPRVKAWCRVKLAVAPVVFGPSTDLSPRWSYAPGIRSTGKWIAKALSLVHRECDVPACHVVSFMWGSGHPAAWMHENLLDVTHQRTADLFGSVNINYYKHIRKMVSAGKAVKMYPDDPRYDLLPDDYLTAAVKLQTPVLFTSGAKNRVFPDSNSRTFRALKQGGSAASHEYKEFAGYGHQDPFMGKNADRDIFPAFLEFVDRH